ncbi:MAG: M28 family peptidase, partial [Pseudomonadota bacterium]
GARGLALLFDDTKDADWAYAAAVYTAQQPVLSWAENEEIAYAPNGDLQAVIAMAPSAAARMFKGAEQSLADVFKAARAGAPSSGFRLDAALTARNLVQYKPMRSANIIARLDAKETPIKQINGAELPQVPGALMLVAHLDHLGVGPAINGDVIYNGALDNALGVASLVETAKALAALPAQWPRDVYFAALTGEEAGLIGAEYLVRHLPMPKLSAVLNIDMPVALYPLATLHASGATHSSLGAVANRAAQGYSLALEADPKPQDAIFIRSDHYAFVKQGIPALYLNIGITDREGDTERGAAALNDFLSSHYHKPSDDLTRPINWQSAATFSDVHVDILRRLAQDTSDVRWTQGSFFAPSVLAAVSSD